MSADGSNPRAVVSVGENLTSPDLSADGRAIAFRSAGATLDELLMVRADGADRVLLASAASAVFGSPAFSPDGRWIAYTRRVDEGSRAIVATATDGSATTVTLFEEPGFSPMDLSWAPDGSAIAYDRSGGGLGVLSLRHCAVTTIVDVPVRRPAWSPDGDEILYSYGIGIAAVRPDGAEQRVIFSGTSEEGLKDDPAWSADGSRIYFFVDPKVYGPATEPPTGWDSDIWSVAAHGSDARNLSDNDFEDLTPGT